MSNDTPHMDKLEQMVKPAVPTENLKVGLTLGTEDGKRVTLGPNGEFPTDGKQPTSEKTEKVQTVHVGAPGQEKTKQVKMMIQEGNLDLASPGRAAPAQPVNTPKSTSRVVDTSAIKGRKKGKTILREDM